MKKANETYRENHTVKNNISTINMKEENIMITTGMFRNYGIIEEGALGTEDVDEYVFQGGEVVRVEDAEASNMPFISGSDEPVFAG